MVVIFTCWTKQASTGEVPLKSVTKLIALPFTDLAFVNRRFYSYANICIPVCVSFLFVCYLFCLFVCVFDRPVQHISVGRFFYITGIHSLQRSSSFAH